jgi:transposase
MGLGRQGDQRGRCFWPGMRFPGLVSTLFYDRLQQILRQSGFDAFVEKLCKPFYSDKGRPSIPPGRYFRMHLVGYFEGNDCERGIE